MKVLLNNDGYVDSYAVIGDIVGSIEVPDFTGDDLSAFEANFRSYRYMDGAFVYDPVPESVVAETPTQLDRIEAQLVYTAMMTNTLLEA